MTESPLSGWDTPELRSELAKRSQQETKRSKLPLIIIGAVSLFLFVGGEAILAGEGGADLLWILWLVLIIAFHEAGHLAAMRYFGYRDLNVFFIPFFGAAATGKKEDATSVERAHVLMAGPLPGILLGCALVMFVPDGFEGHLASVVSILWGLNLLNLLPAGPLDGGRFLGIVLFSRHPVAKGFANAFGAALMGLLAYGLGSWILGGLAVFTVLGIPTAVRGLRAAQGVRAAVGPDALASELVPERHIERVAGVVAGQFQGKTTIAPATLAPLMIKAWQEARVEPPNKRDTLMLLLLYAAAWLVVPRWFLFQIAMSG